MSTDNVTPIRRRVPTAEIVDFDTRAMRDIEEVWRLRAQVLEHIAAMNKLCDRMHELPHVWGIGEVELAECLEQAEAALTPLDDDPDDPKPGDESYPAYRLWQSFKAAKNIEV
jgi:hypothetical protein